MATKITFLGTGTSQGVPMLLSDEPVNYSTDARDKRLRSSAVITYNDKNYLIDCGFDFRQQMINSQIQNIEAIFYTHEHADHIGGLDDIRPFCYKYGAMDIYATRSVMKSLQNRYSYVFATENRYPGVPTVNPHLIEPYQPLQFEDLTVMPIEFLHGEDLTILGYRFNHIAYLTDIKYYSKKALLHLRNLDILVVNALRITPHKTHFNLEEAIEFIKLVKPQKAYLTHISHLLGFHKEVQKKLPDGIFLAYDGLEVTA